MNVIRQAQLLAGDNGATWDEARLAGYFQRFRDQPEVLKALFATSSEGPLVYERLLEVFRASSPGRHDDDWYFIIREPQPLRRSDAKTFALKHVVAMREIAKVLRDQELLDCMQHSPALEFSVERWIPNNSRSNDSPQAMIEDAIVDFMAQLRRRRSHDLLQLSEAFYSLANDQFVQNYTFWPLFAGESNVVAPFDPSFVLWKHGLHLEYVTPGRIRLYGGIEN